MITGIERHVDEESKDRGGTTIALSERLLGARVRLETLRRERGLALLDGEDFDGSQIPNLEAEVDALTVAEGESVRRDRQALEADLEGQRVAKRKAVADLEHQRLEAVRAAEDAALDMMVAFRDVQTISGKMDLAMRSLGVTSWETPPQSVAERLSRRLTSIMRPLLTDGERMFGSIEFPDPRDHWAGAWEDAERALLAPDIAKALQPTTQQ